MDDHEAPDRIRVIGATTNNLCEVSLDIPKKALTVFTGVSGSGKSSLVLDTVAAGAQRLVNDSYPAFLRARLPQLPAPDVQAMSGLTFTVLIDQRRFTPNARSTVATATDLAPLLRLVFSRAGLPSAGYSPAYSFNDLTGMCPTCEGIGTVVDIDVDELIDLDKNIDQGRSASPSSVPASTAGSASPTAASSTGPNRCATTPAKRWTCSCTPTG